MWEKKLFSFETNDEIVEYSSEHGFNDIIFHLLMVKKTFTSCYIKNILLLKKMKIRQ